jgi:hypothetical protein
LAEPVRFGNREFPIGVELAFQAIVPRDEGIHLAPLVASLPKTFTNPAAWSATMRRALVPFDDNEAEAIVTQLMRGPASNRAIASYAPIDPH